MRRSGLVPAGWGFFLMVIAAWDAAFSAVPQEIAMLMGSGFVMVLLGGLSWLSERRGRGPLPDTAEPRPLPDLSVATVVLAIGVAVAIVGIEFGPWCIFIGAGTIAVGVGGLVREFRAERRAVRGE